MEDGRLSIDGGWPWRDADGETRGVTLELPAIGTHEVTSADGGADKSTVWVSKDSRKPVKMSSVMAQMGGATLTAELLP